VLNTGDAAADVIIINGNLFRLFNLFLFL
jgi:hypothetical protein